ncbi:MAG: hypothetical protein JST19_13510 [Bacteroidetes bacterium]|nr:hypothetical protein [Bacteroidota bacterium]
MPLNVAKVKSTIRGWKITYIVLALIISALIVFRLALPGIVKHYVNKQLNALPGYTGHVNDIDIALWRGAYVIKGLHLKKRPIRRNIPSCISNGRTFPSSGGRCFTGDWWAKLPVTARC